MSGQMTTLSPPPVINLKSVTKVYGSGEAVVLALKGIDLTINQGEFVAIMGPSGSGKSTTMNILGCLDIPTSGAYFFQNVNIGKLSQDQRALLRRNAIGFIFQGYNLLKRTSALENTELPLIYRGVPARLRHKLARQALDAVGLQEREKHAPNELSGGQQQRVAIARAIVTEPEVLLADEPTGNLDTVCSQEIMGLLTELNRERGITILMVTHDSEVAKYADRQVHFRDGQIKGSYGAARER